MTENYINICKYKRAMATAKTLLNMGYITKADYCKIDKIIAGKYHVNSCSIYRENP